MCLGYVLAPLLGIAIGAVVGAEGGAWVGGIVCFILYHLVVASINPLDWRDLFQHRHRKIYALIDAAKDTVSTIRYGYDGQEITIAGDQTDGVTHTFVRRVGNLSADAIAVGQGGVLQLVYLKSGGQWRQVSDSHNA